MSYHSDELDQILFLFPLFSPLIIPYTQIGQKKINQNHIQLVSYHSKEESSSNFKIYPNPTNNLIQIEIENYNGSIEAELYDFTGKLLETTNHTNLRLADYPSGIYSLKITYGDRVEEVKVIKE